MENQRQQNPKQRSGKTQNIEDARKQTTPTHTSTSGGGTETGGPDSIEQKIGTMGEAQTS
jgi:hypothetical protein